MKYLFFLFVFLINFISIVTSSNQTLNSSAIIEQFLIFSSNEETVINFDPKQGWLLNEQNKFRLFISGTHLQNSSIVFSSSSDTCQKDSQISPEYRLTSADIISIEVKLDNFKQSHTTAYVCLIPTLNSTLLLNQTNETTSLDYHQPMNGKHFKLIREKDRIPFAAKICLILMLFVVSGFYSGLNLGLMSMSVNDLRLISESEDSSMRYYAKRVLPLRRRGNYLLCSIVIANVLVNSLATVLLDSLVHGLFAVLGSTIMIVLMGEIIPQAICSRYGLVVGAHTHVITWTSMIITGVISYPLGFILDKILGQEVTASYTREQIAGLLTRISADIEKPELDVITGVLSLRKKTVKEAMTWLPDVFMLDKDRKTDTELLLEVHKHGFSRIPVYSHDKSNVIGIVKLRDFALITPEQYHLTVKHLLEFHTHPFGYTKTTDSLYNLMQEFLKSHWHIALVQELRNEEDNVDPVFATVGVITLEDVIEEMLQREIIEEADFFTDNRSKIQRKRAKTMDYTALVKRPVKGPSISPQLKVAVFQFLSTNVPQFTSGFISQEILKVLLNYNIYATIKRQANQTSNSIYLYKKGFRYELFTLVMQGNAMLESGTENIISTVGPFSYFASSALLAENKSIRDVHTFLDHLFTTSDKNTDILQLLDGISSIFVPDYNLIVNSELHVLQIHRLVWLAAVRATQRQRGNDSHFRRMQPEQLLAHALDEISLVTHVPIDKTNLTNFQRIFFNKKGLSQPSNGIGHQNTQTSASVFEAIHSISPTKSNPQCIIHSNGDLLDVHSAVTSSITQPTVASAVLCNPILLTIPSYNQTANNGSCNGIAYSSSDSTNLTENGFDSSMYINRIFDDEHEHDNLIETIRTDNRRTSPTYLSHARSETNLISMSSPIDKKSTNLSNSSAISKSYQDSYDICLGNKSLKCSPS